MIRKHPIVRQEGYLTYVGCPRCMTDTGTHTRFELTDTGCTLCDSWSEEEKSKFGRREDD